MDSSVSPTHGAQEGTAWNGHFGCMCYHPLFVFNQFGHLERCALRPGNVHSADGWDAVLRPGARRRTDMDTLTVRRARAGDLDAIQRFVLRTYGDSAPFKNPDRWRWQYLDNPFRPARDTGSDPAVWIACAGDRVVGQIAVQDGSIRLEREDIPAGWIVDVMVDPEFRGQGLGHRIHDAVMQDRTVLVTLTMATATRRMAERAGCLTLGETRQCVAPLRMTGATVSRFLRHRGAGKRITPLIRAFCATRIGPVLAALALRAVAPRPASVPDGAGEIEEVAAFGPELDTLWAETRDGLSPLFARDAAFLNWRFVDCPGLPYRRFVLRRDGAVRGYLVTRMSDPAEVALRLDRGPLCRARRHGDAGRAAGPCPVPDGRAPISSRRPAATRRCSRR